MRLIRLFKYLINPLPQKCFGDLIVVSSTKAIKFWAGSAFGYVFKDGPFVPQIC